MSSFTSEECPTSTQKNPSDLYHADHSYAPSEHESGKNSNDDRCRGGHRYDSPPSARRGDSDLDSVNGSGSGVKDNGSNMSCHRSTTLAIQDGSFKDFVTDHYENGRNDHRGDGHGSTRSICIRSSSEQISEKEIGIDLRSGSNVLGDTRGSSDCCHGGHDSNDHKKTHQDTHYVSNSKDYVRPGISWLDRRSFHTGEPCASPLDWDHHPTLRRVPPDEHQIYRHAKLEEWLSTAHKRKSKENFGAYIWRASALANSELRHRKKQCWGDEYRDPLDKFVMRLFFGMKLKLERTESIVLGVHDETGILDILREECEDLSKGGQLPFDQRSIQYTPSLMSEMQERSSNTEYGR